MSIVREIASRFLLRGADPFTRFITWVSFIGLLLGVMVLTVVVSVMNGFDHVLKTRLLSAVPHLVLEGDVRVPKGLRRDAAVAAAFPFYEGMAMINRGRAVTPVSVYGLGPGGTEAAQEIDAAMRRGDIRSLQPGSQALVMGAPLAGHLGLALGDPVGLLFPMPDGAGVAPVQQRFRLAGTFELGAELDTTLVLVAFDDIHAGVRDGSGEQGVQVRIHEPLNAPEVASRLAAAHEVPVSTWMDRYGELFRAVRLEKAMMFVILLLVVAVASFNIVSGQLMLVRKKTPAISILRTMGASPRFVSNIFLLQGVLVAGVGIAAGLALGVLAASNINAIVGVLEGVFGVRFLDGTYFVEIPVVVEAVDLAGIAALSGVLTLIAAFLPARRAQQLSPVAGLHGA